MSVADVTHGSNTGSTTPAVHIDVQHGVMLHGERLLTFDECWNKRVANYCEENVWHILDMVQRKQRHIMSRQFQPPLTSSLKGYAVFVTNRSRSVLFRYQRAAVSVVSQGDAGSPGCVFWDYHVIAVVNNWVYDIDSTLPFPSPIEHYVAHSLDLHSEVPGTCDYWFRVVPMQDLFRLFSSDRRHMTGTNSSNSNKCITATATQFAHTLPFFLAVPGIGAFDDGDHLSLGAHQRHQVDQRIRDGDEIVGELFHGIPALVSFLSSDST